MARQNKAEEKTREVPKWPENLKDGQAAEGLNEKDQLALLDYLRRVADTDKPRLFRRAVVSDEYTELLAEAGVLKLRGLPETKCRLNADTGEILCDHHFNPPNHLDCRQVFCVGETIQRMRLKRRLREAYALERSRHAVR